MNLSLDTAHNFVRARLDELAQTSSDMVDAIADDRNLHATVDALLPEAIETVHLSAPTALMEGTVLTESELLPFCNSDAAGVLTIDFTDVLNTDYDNFLRLISLFIGGAEHPVFKAYDENTPEARMQKNIYIQGTPDDPVLVRMSDSEVYKPKFNYHTTPEDLAGLSMRLEYFPVPTLTAGTEGTSYYFIASRLRDNVLNMLTSLVLIAYGQNDRAAVFAQRAMVMPNSI